VDVYRDSDIDGAVDYGAELKSRRDGIVERLYARATSASASASGEQP
jgi:hypothetical protein